MFIDTLRVNSFKRSIRTADFSKFLCMIFNVYMTNINLHCNPWNVFILKLALLYDLFDAACYVKPFLCFIYWVIVSVIS